MKTLTLIRVREAFTALAAASALLWGAIANAQPTITTNYPDGLVQFEATNTLMFTLASSATSLSNLTVTLYGTNMAGKVTTNVLTQGNGLTVSGPSSAEVVTASLNSNIAYYVFLSVADANGLLTNGYRFDTITPAYTWEAEDYDYGGGQFFDSAASNLNAYASLVAISNVDAYNPNGGGAAYRPINTGTDTGGDLGNEVNGDVPRQIYLTTGQSDYDQGWNNGGSGLWGNFTRHYPAGKWNIIARAAGDGSGAKSAVMYQGGINGTLLGSFNVPNTGNWQVYNWTPLVDVAGNLIEFDTDGSAKTLTLAVVGGSYNMNYFMLMPIDPNYKPVPFVSAITPNATNMFASTSSNRLTFTVNSVPGISSNNVVFTLNGVKPNNLTINGSGHVLTFSAPLTTNVVYNVNISLTDANGSSSYSTSFGTFTPTNYTFEAEDFDYNSGLFFDNPQTNAYAGLAGTPGIDAINTQGGNSNYRPGGTGTGVLGNEPCGDVKRAQYLGTGNTNADYDVGWTSGGQFANYTRTFPAGAYNVYFRASSPNSAGQNDAVTLNQVTSGAGTSNQTTVALGRFNVPATGSWQTYAWTPLVDTAGNPVVITNSGKVSTLQMHEDNGGFNANFFMLVPVDTTRPVISQLYPDGTAMFQRTNALRFTVSSSTPLTPSAVQLTVNGVVQNNFTTGGSATNMTVNWPYLVNDTAYSVGIVVNTPNNDAAVASFNFDTFSTNYYTWEAEDYDYMGGLFFDNPQLDSYTNLAGFNQVDVNNTSTGAGAAYRPQDSGDLGNEVTADVKRAQFIAANTNDYDIGWTATGNWANYTRTFPKGSYNVWVRCASPSGTPDAISFSQVTSGRGTGTQTTNFLGRFNVPQTGGYQSWNWAELVDTNGNPVSISTSGQVSTYRMFEDNGGFNANFFMLVPAGLKISAAVSGNTVTISFPSQTGLTYQIQYKNKLTDATWTPLGSSLSGTGGTLSGTDTITAGQGSRFYEVTYH
jgi:hypothetical protein